MAFNSPSGRKAFENSSIADEQGLADRIHTSSTAISKRTDLNALSAHSHVHQLHLLRSYSAKGSKHMILSASAATLNRDRGPWYLNGVLKRPLQVIAQNAAKRGSERFPISSDAVSMVAFYTDAGEISLRFGKVAVFGWMTSRMLPGGSGRGPRCWANGWGWSKQPVIKLEISSRKVFRYWGFIRSSSPGLKSWHRALDGH